MSLLQAQTPTSAVDDPAEHISVGSFYEIDHSKLAPKSPDQLNSIRVVVVNEKTRNRVSLRFPSICSLRAYFNENNCTKPDLKKLPSLDEKYIMGSETAAEALYRRIPHHEITENKSSLRFWAVSSVSALDLSNSRARRSCNVVSKKGSLWSELKDTGMVTWGQRRQVRYLATHIEDKGKSICNVTVGKEEEEEDEEENDSEGIDEEEKQFDMKEIKARETRNNSKRKQLQRPSRETPKKKRPKHQIVVYKHKKNKVLKNSIDRWSAERYKLAEKNMLRIMKEQGAVFGRPILRPELRAQARKLIGDTGLLDHLLKHMAGKVAPGGEERFRRRHNAEGAMEYWLEKADLVDIRREAGVQDPYWTPPPGWHPGDNPTQDPICAQEIKNVKEQISKLEMQLELLVSKKHDEEQAAVTTPISSVTSFNIEHDNIVTPLKEMFIDLMNKRTKIEEQLMDISEFLCGMEEEMEKLKTTVEEANKTEPFDQRIALMALPESAPKAGTEIEREETAEQKKKAEISEGDKEQAPTTTLTLTEDKAAKIQRLKSGFRLCKPQGTFLWPNRAISGPQVVVQFEDLFSVPTPPSVSSTSATEPHLIPASPSHGPLPTSPVRPLAEKRAGTIALSTAATSPTSTAPATKTSMINLNEFPSNQNENVPQSHGQSSCYPVTYQRRTHHSVTNNSAFPCGCNWGPAKKEMIQWQECDQGKELMRSCEQKQQDCCSNSSTSSCLTMGVRTWLALATSRPTLID